MRHGYVHSALLFLLVCFVTCSLAAAQVSFSPPANYAVGVGPEKLAFGDFNGDGITDLAVVFSGNPGTGTVYPAGVSLLLGKGDGTFGAANNIFLQGNPTDILAGDFNGDGQVDLLVGGSEPFVAQYGVLLGNGDGTFQSAIYTNGLPNPIGPLVVADFNGDGKSDVAGVVQNYPNATLYIFTSNGDGTFQQAASYPLPGQYPLGIVSLAMVAADFNGDRKTDVAMSNSLAAGEQANPIIDVMLGNGDGTLQPLIRYDINSEATTIIAGPFGTSARPDLVGGGPSLFIFSNDGSGAFIRPYSFFEPCQSAPDPSSVSPSVASGDFNGDGKLDVLAECAVVGTYLPPKLHVDLGNGNDTFQSPLVLTPKISISSIAAVDVNNDGLADITLTDFNNNSVVVQLNTSPLFSLVPSNPNLTVHRGGQVSEAINVTAAGSFNSAVALSCSMSTPQASCLISPSSVMPGNSATLTVNGSAASAALHPAGRALHSVPFYALVLPFIGMMVLLGEDGKGRNLRRKGVYVVLGAALLTFSLLQAACGGGGGGTAPGNYTVTVTGISGTTTRSTTVSLTVQ